MKQKDDAMYGANDSKSSIATTHVQTCAGCGMSIPAGAHACPWCGRRVRADDGSGGPLFEPAEGLIGGSEFATPMDPGPFRTPMRPWTAIAGPDEAQPEEQVVVTRSEQDRLAAERAPRPAPPVASTAAREPEPDSKVVARLETYTEPQPTGAPGNYGPGRVPQYQGQVQQWKENQASEPRPLPDQNGSVSLPRRDLQYRYKAQQPQGYWPYQTNAPRKSGYSQTRLADVCFYLEMLGYIGFLGIGHIYGGQVKRGLMLLFGWWILLGWVLGQLLDNRLEALAFLTTGAIAAPILSGLWIRSEVAKSRPS